MIEPRVGIIRLIFKTRPSEPFSCTYSPHLPELLAELDCSLAISTHQAAS